MRDPYLYPDMEVLKNLLGIIDSEVLQKAESDYVTLRLSEIAEDERLVGVFDFSALCQMHYRIFQDIYEWAGKPRIMNIEKIETVLNGISVEYSDVFDIERDALVAASAIFSDLGDKRKPEYLYKIVGDALERGKETEEDAARRIKKARCPTGREQVRKVIFRERWQCQKCSEEEIRQLFKRKEREE